MKKEEIILRLKQNNIEIEEESKMPDGRGTIIKTSKGCIINIYNTGKHSIQGKNREPIEAVLNSLAETGQTNNVFVVYGHNKTARNQLEAMLRRWNLEPIILDQMPSSGATIIEKLEKCIKETGFGIVLATPDDIGYPSGGDEKKKFRVRQNVVLELGMLLAKLGRSKVAILLSTAEEMEKPSDIEGLVYIPFKDDVEEAKVLLAKELKQNGYEIDLGRL